MRQKQQTLIARLRHKHPVKWIVVMGWQPRHFLCVFFLIKGIKCRIEIIRQIDFILHTPYLYGFRLRTYLTAHYGRFVISRHSVRGKNKQIRANHGIGSCAIAHSARFGFFYDTWLNV